MYIILPHLFLYNLLNRFMLQETKENADQPYCREACPG